MPAEFTGTAIPSVPEKVVQDYTALLSGQSWANDSAPGVSVIVTYSFATSPAGYVGEESLLGRDFAASFQPLTGNEKIVARDAINQWAAASGLIALEDTSGNGDIQFGKYDLSLAQGIDDSIAGFAFYPYVHLGDDGAYQLDVGGDVFIDIDNNFENGTDVDALLVLHELGHALGLKHPFEDDPILPGSLATTEYTVMAYEGGRVTTLQQFDLEAVAYLYGGPDSDGAGLPAWSWDAVSNTLTQTGTAAADAVRGVHGANRIFGAGGADTVLGGAGSDLLDGSDGDDRVDGGGDGTDTILGGEGNDTMLGGAGSDRMEGGAGDDQIDSGWGGKDTLLGGEGNDSLIGSPREDRLEGGAGNDTLDGYRGPDTVLGGAGDDLYYVFAPATKIIEAAGGGDDTLIVSHDYTLTPGAEIEHISIEAKSFNVTGNDTGQTIDGNDLNNRIAGLGGTDTIKGGRGSDTLDGGDGNDVVNGGDGSDTLTGGAGNDRLIAGTETGHTTNELNGGAGTDTLVGSLNSDTYINPLGDTIEEPVASERWRDLVMSDASYSLADAPNVEDLALTGTADLTGTGSEAANVIWGSAGHNTLYGLGGDDTLNSGGGGELAGGLGDDTYRVTLTAGQTTTIIEGVDEGIDEVEVRSSFSIGQMANVENLHVASGVSQGAKLIGNGLNNRIEGGEGNDQLLGGQGDDTLIGNGGRDTMTGGTGDDLYDLTAGPTDGVVIEQDAGGLDTVITIDSFSLVALPYVENVILKWSARTAEGNAANNLLVGLWDSDTLIGGDGNDTLHGGNSSSLSGGAGEDHLIAFGSGATMAGGDGSDLYSGVRADTVLVEQQSAAGFDTIETDFSRSLGTLTGFEGVTLTGTAAVDAIGNGAGNRLVGNAANNSLSGLGGHDTLGGGAGADTLIGGAGNDLYVDPTGDTIVEQTGEGIDRIDTVAAFSLLAAPNVERLALTGTGDINGYGNALDNVVLGNAGANKLSGAEGSDTLDGGTGADTLNGGTGVDQLRGGAGDDLYLYPVLSGSDADTIVEHPGSGIDTVQSDQTISLAQTANVENLVLVGKAAINGTGNAMANRITGNDRANRLSGLDGNDTLEGGGGSDTLAGSSGRDVLIGDAGNDLLNGGKAADIFVFAASASGSDTIIGFEQRIDRFDLSGAAFTKRVEAGSDTTLTYSGGTIVVSGVTGLDLDDWNALVTQAYSAGTGETAIQGAPDYLVGL